MEKDKHLQPGRIKDPRLAREMADASDDAMTKSAGHTEEAGYYKKFDTDTASEHADLSNMYRSVADREAVIAAKKYMESTGESLDDVETEEALSDNELLELLSYSDVLSGEEAQAAIEFTKNSPNGMAYLQELRGIIEQYGWPHLRKIAEKCRDQILAEAESLKLEPTKFAESTAWALWDIAKQHYYFSHPDQQSAEYNQKISQNHWHEIRPVDPLDSEHGGAQKLYEIKSRHIGWELDVAYQEGRYDLDNLPANKREAVRQILDHGERNESGQLRSYELARLGFELS